MSGHYSIEPETADDLGFYDAKCNCGWHGGKFPDIEDACDALMEHAYNAGWADGRGIPSDDKAPA